MLRDQEAIIELYEHLLLDPFKSSLLYSRISIVMTMGLVIYQKIFTKTALSKIFRHHARWQKFLDSAVLVKNFW